MNKKIICVVLSFYSLTVLSQQKILQKCNAMEKIDINNTKIKSLKKNENFIEKHGDTVTSFFLTNDDYQVTEYSKKSPYKAKKAFFLNGSIKIENYYFYNVPIGISKIYDDKGNIVKVVDHDNNPKRSFTIDQLHEKIQSELGINLKEPNLAKDESYSVDFHLSDTPSYTVSVRKGNSYRTIEINAMNGDTLWERTGIFEK